MGASSKLARAFERFDKANAKDPNQELLEGTAYPKELLYAQRMTETLNDFFPEASEALQLAARCQHLRRWEIPRERYEMNRVGYLKWRQELKKFHSEKAGEILQQVGYGQDTIDRVAFLLLKKQLKRDEETQALEDVICLVFLKYYFEPFREKHDAEKMASILKKTWNKMSEAGRKAALSLNFTPAGKELISKALSL